MRDTEQGCPEKRAGGGTALSKWEQNTLFGVIFSLVMEGLLWGWATDADAAMSPPAQASG